MAKYFGIYANSGDVLTAIEESALTKPYVALVSGVVDYDTVSPAPPAPTGNTWYIEDSEGNIYQPEAVTDNGEGYEDTVWWEFTKSSGATFTVYKNGNVVTANAGTYWLHTSCDTCVDDGEGGVGGDCACLREEGGEFADGTVLEDIAYGTDWTFTGDNEHQADETFTSVFISPQEVEDPNTGEVSSLTGTTCVYISIEGYDCCDEEGWCERNGGTWVYREGEEGEEGWYECDCGCNNEEDDYQECECSCKVGGGTWIDDGEGGGYCDYGDPGDPGE